MRATKAKVSRKSTDWNKSIVFKLTVCMCLFILPLGILFFLYTGSLNDTIDFGSKEQTGTQFLQILHRFAIDVPKFDQKSGLPSLSAARDQIAKLYAVNGQDMKLSAEELKSRNRSSIEPQAMLALIDQFQANPNPEMKADLNSRIHVSITHIGDVSNLILDPDLDSYYLMDVVLLAVPQTLYRIDETRGLLEKAKLDNLQAGIQAALFKQSDLSRINDDMTTVFLEDANFYGVSPSLRPRLEPLAADFQVKGGKLLEALSQPDDTSGLATALSLYEKSLDIFWQTGLEELNLLLGIRIANYYNRLLMGWCLTMIVLIAAIFLVILILYRILGQIQANGKFIHHLSLGDFSTNVRKLSNDELGNMSTELGSLGGIWAGNIKEIAKSGRHLKGSSHRLETTGNELIGINDGLNKNIQGISAAIEELESSLASINGTVGHQFSLVAQASDQLNEVQLAGEVTGGAVTEIGDQMEKDRLAAHGGKASIAESFTEVSQLSQDLGNIAHLVQELGIGIRGVQDIVDSITDISQRTSLLAMNAGIEAAHAGELGKGFSVVAKEIQNLAIGVDTSTKSISDRIKGLQKGAENALAMAKSLNASSGRLEDRMAASTKTLDGIIMGIDALASRVEKLRITGANQGKAVGKLVLHIEELRNLSSLIRGAVEEQALGAREITQSIISIKESTHAANVTTEFVGELSSQLKHEGELLSELISHYILPAETNKEG